MPKNRVVKEVKTDHNMIWLPGTDGLSRPVNQARRVSTFPSYVRVFFFPSSIFLFRLLRKARMVV